MSFESDLARFRDVVTRRSRDIHARSVQLTYQSVVEGSPLTGSPGQPVDTGNLKTSWQIENRGEYEDDIQTVVEYAPFIEYGGQPGSPTGAPGPGRKRKGPSLVGGHGSVQLTVANFDLILAAATREVI